MVLDCFSQNEFLWGAYSTRRKTIFWGPTKVGSANLERSYRRAPKGAGQNGDFEVQGAGICHLCTCGMGVDWENLPLLFCIELINILLFLYTH